MPFSEVNLCGFLCGSLAGVCGTAIGHPADTIKVRLHFEKTGFVESIVSIYRHEGFKGYYKGVSFPFVMKGVINSIYFGFYSMALQYLTGSNKKLCCEMENLSPYWHTKALCAGIFGSIGCVIVNTPVEAVKVRLQLSKKKKLLRPTGMVKLIYNHAGLKGFYRGFGATGLRDLPQYSAYPVVYEHMVCKMRLYFLHGNRNIISEMLAGGLTGIICWIPVVPADVIKSRIQGDDLVKPKYKGTIDCCVKSYEKDGLSVFRRGLLFGSWRAFCINSIVLPVFENFVGMCEKKMQEG